MPSLASSLPFSPAELAYLHSSLASVPPLRPDARSSGTDFRPLHAETGVLPAVNGSAHVGFSDGREAIVGVKLEVEKTKTTTNKQRQQVVDDTEMTDTGAAATQNNPRSSSKPEWISLTLTVPGVRDDDSSLAFLEEMLREPLVTALTESDSAGTGTNSVQDKLVINSRWHWHVYIDVLLISPNGLASYPLPLLSMATHLALRDTRVPKLKSEGEEDPVADDDWMASTYLYPRKSTGTNAGGSAGATVSRPPVILLVVVVGENAIFDPSREELAVADGLVAVSVATSSSSSGGGERQEEENYRVLAVRMIDTPARDTMKGVPRSGEAQEGVDVPGVWRPRVGGIKRSLLKAVIKAVVVDGVARDVMTGLDGFLNLEEAGVAKATAGAV
ncbi:Exosome complex component rrp42 [Exophiala dermatitidis]|uniref:Ribosomal RNA-processing protein 42 n=2 Tax=Exophiala dermatitidis TaxID=5970 RepID=H6C8B1_EXODN|nr:3' exoribonuclease [Exophiala dermatitidis NIH/UT8656]KAJ4523452.1 Exosome complex component rrp42 [Exophiala dermatitidis]EHY60338.1 3' exoribonuclease [Exophiala dermatitidis NIH/UT8656]KAJ4524499.1 Exosome complex component rrp42 [Exophiala dermatitidis]KAJ4527348.1 Exosome complex component rrp42 [Exophiala dermatitidis]KAJ4530904.1 Exosome complex component rrp42 [Exophiala dermatitidis]